MKYFIECYKFIKGEDSVNCQVIFKVADHITEKELWDWIVEYFEYFYGEEEEDFSRDGCVCLYNEGELSIQFSPYPKQIPNSIGEWFEKNPTLITVTNACP